MTLTLELYQGEKNKGQIVQNIPSGQTSFNWKVGSLLGNKRVVAGANYRIKILIGKGRYYTQSEPFGISK
jgi:hypothetical protein